MPYRFWLLASILLLMSGPGITLAQAGEDLSQLRYIEELKQRNADYGPGCNGIGVSLPQAVDLPADLSTRWVGGHSACMPGMRLIMSCLGEVVGDDRLIGCTLRVADGQAPGTLTCDRLTLLAPGARFSPDPSLSGALSQGSAGASQPCSEPGALEPGATIAAAFGVPAAETVGDLAMLIDVDGSEVPAFLIPAGQLGLAQATPVP